MTDTQRTDAARPVLPAILCAGYGSRLAPLTDAVPKPLLPFLNTPIVTYALGLVSQLGAQRVGVNLHHLADAIPPVVDRLAQIFGMKPVYAREWEILGSGGGVRGLWKALGEEDGTMVVLNGDSVMDIDLADLLRRHRESGRLVTMVCRRKADDQPGRVFVGADGELVGVRDYRRPGASVAAEYDFTGVHFLEPAALERLPLDPCDIIDTLYGPMLQADEAIGLEEVDGFWAALDNPKLFLDTQREVLSNPGLFQNAPLPEPLSPGHYVYAPDEVDDKAQVAGPIFLGMNAKVESGARIGPNVVADGVEIAGDAVVSNAVLFGQGRVEGEWRDCIAIANKVAQL
jgi:mannose-1-phosphate guanylyltransferase